MKTKLIAILLTVALSCGIASASVQVASSYGNKAGMIKMEEGKEYIWAYASAALTAKTLYALSHDDENNPEVVAVPSGAVHFTPCVPIDAVSSGDWFWAQTRGAVSDVVVPTRGSAYTADRALSILSGAISQEAAAPNFGDEEFAVTTETKPGGSTTLDIYLYGREILGRT